MKLLNYSVKYLSIAMLILITLWSIVFYFSMLSEIKSSIDEELENRKRLIINNFFNNPEIIEKTHFDENLYTIQKISREKALATIDQYSDNEIFMQDADDPSPELEPVRMLTTAFKANNQFYLLKIANPIIEQNDLVKALLWNVVGLYTALVLGMIYINNFTLKKIWQPFYKFMAELKSYKIDKLKPLGLQKTKIKEFNDLQQAVSLMNNHSLKAYSQQKEFIENASHELQTPLAIASNKLELLFENSPMPDNQAKKITETYQIIQRLINFNKSLLLLSKIENRQFSDIENININEIINQILTELNDFVAYKNLKTTFNNHTILRVSMDKNHAFILISNLIKNAIFHNVDGGSIEISTENRSIKICNTAKSGPLNPNLIFNRFQKDPSSNKNTGLGLSIVKAIVGLYDAKIDYYFKDNKHYFELSFNKIL